MCQCLFICTNGDDDDDDDDDDNDDEARFSIFSTNRCD